MLKISIKTGYNYVDTLSYDCKIANNSDEFTPSKTSSLHLNKNQSYFTTFNYGAMSLSFAIFGLRKTIPHE